MTTSEYMIVQSYFNDTAKWPQVHIW